MYAEFAAVILPVFIAVAIGFAWARSGRPFAADFITSLVTTIGTPCLVASALTTVELDRSVLASMALAGVLAYVGFFALGALALKVAGLSYRSYLPAVVFPNAGNMGLPLALFAFGEEGLAVAVVFYAMSALLQFTLGVAIAAGEVNLGRLIRMPLIYAVAASLVVLATGARLPLWLGNTLDLLGGLTIPLLLVSLGVALARMKVTSLGRALSLSLVRLLGGLAVGLAVAWALDLPQPGRGVLILQAAMPVAVFSYLFADLYRREPAEVAGMVVTSTVLSFITLPLLLLLAW